MPRPAVVSLAVVVALLGIAAPATAVAAPVREAGIAAVRAPAAVALTHVAGHRISIDPGHNGGNSAAFNNHIPAPTRRLIDAGIPLASPQCDTSGTASYGGYAEHAYNFDVAVRLQRILKAAGAKVTLTRHSDTGSMGPCTSQRAAIGNKAEVAISIHADGGDAGRGFHVIYPTVLRGYTDDIAAPSYRLALAVRNAMRTTGLPDSTYVGSKGLNGRQNLVGLLLSNVPKVFLESGAMHNSTDARLLGSAAFRQRIAVALAGAFNRYFAPR